MNFEIVKKELQFKAIRSSGAGGQHVNKVSSKIELSFNVKDSLGISSREKELLLQRLAHKLTKERILILTCQETRSQHKNKQLILNRLFELLTQALQIQKKRKATKPTKTSIKKRIQTKKINALKKSLRKKPNTD